MRRVPTSMPAMKTLENLVEKGIFASRWLLAPLYIGLIIGQLLFSYMFFSELMHMVHELPTMKPHAFIIPLLGLVDMIMVANLIVMVVIGGYATFVSKLDLDDHADRPDWLDHIDPGTLKTKLAGALVSISAIHLLQSFALLGQTAEKQAAGVAGPAPDYQIIMWQVIIHVTFIVTTLLLAWSDLIFERKLKMAHGGKEAASSADEAH